jgi:uncharacterized DUF497 family protein
VPGPDHELPGFEWDPGKAKRNRQKHGVGFREATTVFDDPQAVTVVDTWHSGGELRWITIGRSALGRWLKVMHVERGSTMRIISARPASRRELP